MKAMSLFALPWRLKGFSVLFSCVGYLHPKYYIKGVKNSVVIIGHSALRETLNEISKIQIKIVKEIVS